MKTILIIVLVLALIAGAVFVGTKFFGLTPDEDKDGIPDVVEDAVDDVKKTAQTVKRRAKRVKEELTDVKEALKDVVDQTKDIAEAAKGKPRKGRKPSARKASNKPSTKK